VFITGGGESEIYIIFATTDRSKGYRGINAYIVEKGTKGFSFGEPERKLGICASPTCSLFFEDCRIPVENQLGPDGKGFSIALATLDAARIGIAAQAVGIARAALEDSIEYSKERVQFGQPIANFQAIQWMLADMATAIDAARLLTYRAAYAKDTQARYTKEAAMAKVFASEVAMDAAVTAVQIHGGYGYTKEHAVERYMRDAKITEIYEGTSEIQRLVIAMALGLWKD
jgi:alkylation response protein AidB-like acyl-CoA dehydrogenase